MHGPDCKEYVAKVFTGQHRLPARTVNVGRHASVKPSAVTMILLQGRRLRGNRNKRFPKGYNRKLIKENVESRATNAKVYHVRKADNTKPVLKPGDHVRVRIQGS